MLNSTNVQYFFTVNDASLQTHRFFCAQSATATAYLRVKGRVGDHGVDKHPQVVLDHEGAHFQLGTLVFALATVLGDVVS